MKTWTHREGDSYLIIGKDREGNSFRIRTTNPWYALGINLWNGNVWHCAPPTGGRKREARRLIKSVTN